jgi:hypothetical protein
VKRAAQVKAKLVLGYWHSVGRARDIASKVIRRYDTSLADIQSRFRIEEYERERIASNVPVAWTRPSIDELNTVSEELGVTGMTVEEHQAQMMSEREKRLATTQALITGQIALVTMPVVEKSQELVVEELESEMPLTSPAAQDQQDSPMIDGVQTVEAITHTAHKNETTSATFRDSAYDDGEDAQKDDDVNSNISFNSDFDPDNAAFETVGQSDLKLSNPSSPRNASPNLPIGSLASPDGTHATNGDHQDTTAEPGQDTAKPQHEPDEPPEQVNTTVFALEDRPASPTSIGHALRNIPVPTAGLSEKAKGKQKKLVAERGDAEYHSDSSEKDMPAESDGTRSGFKLDMKVKLGSSAPRQEDSDIKSVHWLSSEDGDNDNIASQKMLHEAAQAEKDAAAARRGVADKSPSSDKDGKRYPDAKKAIYWFEEDDSDSDSDDHRDNDSDKAGALGVVESSSSNQDTASKVELTRAHSEPASPSSAASPQDPDLELSNIVESTRAHAEPASPSSAASLRKSGHPLPHTKRVNALVASLWNRYVWCRIAGVDIETIDIKSDLSQYTEKQLRGYVKAFLTDNSSCFAPYMAVVRVAKIDGKKSIEYSSLSVAWHSMDKRIELCGAIKWLLALLYRFAPAIREVDQGILQPKLLRLKAMEEELLKARHLLDIFSRPKSAELLENDAAWQRYHEEVQAVRDSNERRKDLLAHTSISKNVIQLFNQLLVSAELFTGDAIDLGEDTSAEFLRESLGQILDIVRFNDCNVLVEDIAPPQHYPKEKYFRIFDGRVNFPNEDELLEDIHADRNYKGNYKGVTKDEANDDLEIGGGWKGAFPPNIRPNFEEQPATFFDVDCWSNQKVAVERMAWLKTLAAPTFYRWIILYTHRITDFEKSMQAMVEELNRLDAVEPVSLIHGANDSFKYVPVLNPIEARKTLKEKQLWFRDYVILVFSRIRWIMKIWTGEPDNVETEEMTALVQRINESESRFRTIQPGSEVTCPWDPKKCLKINRPEGCALFEEGLCTRDHSSKGTVCPSVFKSQKCNFGDACYMAHPGGATKGSRPSNIRVPAPVAAGGASQEHTPRTPGTSTGWCMFVNKPGGCRGKEDGTCTFNHANFNVECKAHLAGHCTRGNKCAFLHCKPDPAIAQRSAPGTPRITKDTDLKSLLDQVLAEPRRFRVCTFVNSPQGCFKGDDCAHNHTLAGVNCPDNSSGTCVRGRDCPLLHKQVRVSSKRPYDGHGVSQESETKMEPKRPRLEVPSQIASPATPGFTPKHFMTNAGTDGQQGGMPMPIPMPNWPTHGQQSQQQQGPQFTFSAPMAPGNAQNQHSRGPSPAPAWPTQSTQSPQSGMNALLAAGPLWESNRPSRGPAQGRQFSQQSRPQPPPNAPRGPRTQQQPYNAQQARGVVRPQQPRQAPQAHVPGRQQQPHQASQAPVPARQQQLFGASQASVPVRHQQLYQPPPARAPAQQMQRQANTAPRSTGDAFSVRGAADRLAPRSSTNQQPPNRQAGGGRKRGREDCDSGDENRDIDADGQLKLRRRNDGKQHGGRHNGGRHNGGNHRNR